MNARSSIMGSTNFRLLGMNKKLVEMAWEEEAGKTPRRILTDKILSALISIRDEMANPCLFVHEVVRGIKVAKTPVLSDCLLLAFWSGVSDLFDKGRESQARSFVRQGIESPKGEFAVFSREIAKGFDGRFSAKIPLVEAVEALIRIQGEKPFDALCGLLDVSESIEEGTALKQRVTQKLDTTLRVMQDKLGFGEAMVALTDELTRRQLDPETKGFLAERWKNLWGVTYFFDSKEKALAVLREFQNSSDATFVAVAEDVRRLLKTSRFARSGIQTLSHEG